MNNINVDKIVNILKLDKNAMQKFEEAYKKSNIGNLDKSSIFNVSIKDATSIFENPSNKDYDKEYLDNIINRIVTELINKDTVDIKKLSSNGFETVKLLGTQTNTEDVALEDIKKLPKSIRSQLSGNFIMKDISGETYPVLLDAYYNYFKSKDINKKKTYYNMFRQGLDILDLDPIVYEMISMNKNSMGYWLPALSIACSKQTFFKIPETTIVKVPMQILQLTRLDYDSLSNSTLKIVDDWAMKAFNLDVKKSYFVKTGTYSSKFDFRNCKVTGEDEVRELGEYLLFIHNQAIKMAGPLCKPTIYGVSTTNEWVVREFIEDTENNPTIYKGLPLHTEYRIFIDLDKKDIIGYTPYWDADLMLKRFSNEFDNSIHDRHDYIIYKSHEDILYTRYKDNIDSVIKHVKELISNMDLKGQWSMDIMQNGDDFWVIDMATADTSALNNCVPSNLLKRSNENWLPEKFMLNKKIGE